MAPTVTGPLRIELTAPDSIPPGESVQLTATVFRADGSTEDVTRQAQWSSTHTGVLRVAADGVATAVNNGEASISVRYQGRIAAKNVLAVPTGTFKLTGTVREDGSPIGGVRLTVVSGLGTGLTGLTADNGSFGLFGVGGVVRIELTKAGYVRNLEEVTVTANARHDIAIVAERERRDLRGTYALSVTAECGPGSRGVLPEAVRRRIYTATVTQTGPTLMVQLAGDLRGKTFFGVVDPNDDVRFNLLEEDFYYDDLPAIIEQLEPGVELQIGGVVGATATSTRIEGTLTGYIRVVGRVAAQFSNCQGTHRFLMRRE
jgi:hypothetical protein